MNDPGNELSPEEVAAYNSRFPHFHGIFSTIGAGEIGGKARGLLDIRDRLLASLERHEPPGIRISIPTSTVVATGVFEAFLDRNQLHDLPFEEMRDDQIAHAFQRADLPAEFVGDLRALAVRVREPLAIRSSSLFEDQLHRPFAGVYATKMVPNNQTDPDHRFKVLKEAVKFVYASTFFKEARAYAASAGKRIQDERMAVLVQQVVGSRHRERFYPDISGVGRSYNFYRSGAARPEDGTVSLALGLGKTIVDGGLTWNYSPRFPRANPPYRSVREMLDQTQTEFWAVNMGQPPEHDPIHETEYLVRCSLSDAEADETLPSLVSTWQPDNDRLVIGAGVPGPRVLTFAPILALETVPLSAALRGLLDFCRERLGTDVEIEFAITLQPDDGGAPRLSLLQVRPMLVDLGETEVAEAELSGERVLVASTRVLGNGVRRDIRDVVYLRRNTFTEREAWSIVNELEALNEGLQREERPALLIVHGRLGTDDPAYGVPVNWSQISAARTIVEISRPDLNLESSQGSHFFHNIIGSQVGWFGLSSEGGDSVDWKWLAERPAVMETEFLRHVRLDNPVEVRIDGRNGRGVIRK